jgi:hypothetical protein
MGYLFDRRGQVRKEFVKERRRKDLVDGLRHRFVFMGCLNLLFSPFIVIYLLIYSFFRYFEVSPIFDSKGIKANGRNTTRTHPRSADDNIHPTPSGNSVNSTNYPTCLNGGWIGVIQ